MERVIGVKPMAKKSLLDKAQEHKAIRSRKSRYSEEEMQLALAWVNDEIMLSQVMHAIQDTIGTGNVYAFLALCLKQVIRNK